MRLQIKRHSSALSAIFVRGLGVVAGFAITLAVGRNWGPEANGVYAIVTQTAIFVAVLVAGGLDVAIVRYFAAAIGRGHRVALASILYVLGITLALVSVAIVIIQLCRGWLTEFGGLPEISEGLISLLLAMIAARAFTRVLSGIARAYGYNVFGQAIDGLIIPAIVLGPLMLGLLPDVEATLEITAIAGVIAVVVGLIVCRTAFDRQTPHTPIEQVPIRSMLTAAVPLWGLGLALNISDWYGLTIVMAHQGPHDAGLYRVAVQFASAFTIVSVSLFGVYSPRISAAHATGDWRKVAQIASTATRLGTALVLPAGLLLVIAAPHILLPIGSEFVEGSTMMRVAVMGQVLCVALGPPGITLVMIGRERIVFAISVACMLWALLIAPIAAASLGALGVIISLSSANIIRSLAEFFVLRHLTGVNSITGRYSPPHHGNITRQ